MKFDSVILGGGLSGLIAGISLQQEGQHTAIVSMGQNALHFFSGSFESLKEPSDRLLSLFNQAGVRVHYQAGVRLMPLGSFKPAALSLEDVDIFPSPAIGKRALIVNFQGYHDFFSSFLAEGLEKQGLECRIRFINIPDMLQAGHGEMRPVQLARTMDRQWEKAVQEIRLLLKGEDIVVLPQVFGLQDISVPSRIRQALPARVVFAGTMPPSIPGIRTLILLRKRYSVLGGTYLLGDEALRAHIHDGVVHSIATRNLDNHYLEAAHFIISTGGLFAKGLKSNPNRISEPIMHLDVDFPEDRNAWYHPSFSADQPYLHFGLKTDEHLHPLLDGVPVTNLYAAGSVLGASHPEYGFGAGLSVNSAFAAVDEILNARV